MRLRFSIRDLLWLTLVVALIVGWWLDRKKLSSMAERVDLPAVAPLDYMADPPWRRATKS